jgi:hypothetical protein
MYEQHKLEQYFFDPPTIEHLANFVAGYANPCCLCTPLIGQALEKRGVAVRTLDIDERFATLKGFRKYNIYRPHWLGETFGLIICDPPFFNISLSQLFTALRILSRYDYAQPMLVAYLVRRGANLMHTFHLFNLRATDCKPSYLTVQTTERNEIEFYGNLGDEAHTKLAATVLRK